MNNKPKRLKWNEVNNNAKDCFRSHDKLIDWLEAENKYLRAGWNRERQWNKKDGLSDNIIKIDKLEARIAELKDRIKYFEPKYYTKASGNHTKDKTIATLKESLENVSYAIDNSDCHSSIKLANELGKTVLREEFGESDV